MPIQPDSSSEITGGSARFRLLGTDLRVAAPASLLDAQRLVFGWFEVADTAVSPDIDVAVVPVAGGFSLTVRRDGRAERRTFDVEQRAFGFLYARILDEVTRREPALLCVHAAALAHDGRGIALAAASQHGKSTLALALSARGFDFLSDEVAPVRRADRMLLPFPMAVGCRRGTYELLRGTPFAEHTFAPLRYSGKMLYEPSSRSSHPFEAAPLAAVIFVEPPDEGSRPRRRFRLYLDPSGPAPSSTLAASLAALDGVATARAEPRRGAVALELDGTGWAAPDIEGLLEREGLLVSAVEDLEAPRPQFDRRPELTRLSSVEGLLSLLRHLRGFAAVRELAAASGGFGALLFELGETLGPVGFHRLTPGRLPAMVQAVESVLHGP